MADEPSKNARACGFDAKERHDVTAACLAVLVRYAADAGMTQDATARTLRDAPDKIAAALTRGHKAVVLYRLDPGGARGIVSDRDAALEAFVAEANRDQAPLVGLNPTKVAALAWLMNADASIKSAGLMMEETYRVQ